jgi:hypothetical protein
MPGTIDQGLHRSFRRHPNMHPWNQSIARRTDPEAGYDTMS